MKQSDLMRKEASYRRLTRCGLLGLSVTVALCAISPAVALASDVGLSGSTISYVAGTGEANAVTVASSGSDITVTDTGVATIADADGADGCSVIGNQATCPAAGVTLISVETKDGNDTITVDPSVTVPSRLDAGDGNDTITSNNGVADTVLCGNGIDFFTPDALDTYSGCEDDGVDPAPVTIHSGPPATTNSTDATFEFSSPDPAARFSCTLDAATAACSSPRSYSGLGDGPHTFTVRATDEGGRTADSDLFSWTIDTTLPAVTIDSGPSGAIDTRSATFGFSSPDLNASFQCALDGSDWVECRPPTTYSNLPEGEHAFSVRAKDSTGHFGAQAGRAFTVAVPKPAGTLVTLSSKPLSSLVLISGRTLTVSKRGLAQVALNCSGARDCAGKLILATSKPVRISRKRIVRLGSASFTIPAARTMKVKVRLSKRKLTLVRRLRRLKADVVVKDRDGAGRARLSTRTVFLRSAR